MDTAYLVPLIELLDDSIDDLEEAMEPLLKIALSDTAGKLPLLDKAQLYVLVTYAIESIIFSYLRLNGVKAKEHPVFRELTRVKQYFEKIKIAESAGTKPTKQLDKAAAARFIKHALAGNDKHNQNTEKRQGEAREATHTHFQEIPNKRKLDSNADTVSANISQSSDYYSASTPASDSEHTSKEPRTLGVGAEALLMVDHESKRKRKISKKDRKKQKLSAQAEENRRGT